MSDAEGAEKAVEARKILTDTALDVLKELPYKTLRRYCTQAGLSARGGRSREDLMAAVEEWRGEPESSRHEGPQREGWREEWELEPSSSDGEEEDSEPAEHRGPKRRRVTSSSSESEAGSFGRLRHARKGKAAAFSTSQASKLVSLVDTLDEKAGGEEVALMKSEVTSLVKAYNRLKMETDAKNMWPELKMTSNRGQHEFDFIVKLGRMVSATDRGDLAGLQDLYDNLLQELKIRGAQIFIGETESWDMAKRIRKARGTFLDEMKEEIEVARKESKASRSKSKEEGKKQSFRRSPQAGASPAGSAKAAAGWGSDETWGRGGGGSEGSAGTRTPLPPRSMEPRRCFICDDTSHLFRDCPKRASKSNLPQ